MGSDDFRWFPMVPDGSRPGVTIRTRHGVAMDRPDPDLDRVGSDLDRFGSDLERIWSGLDRIGSACIGFGSDWIGFGLDLNRIWKESGSDYDEKSLFLQKNW